MKVKELYFVYLFGCDDGPWTQLDSTWTTLEEAQRHISKLKSEFEKSLVRYEKLKRLCERFMEKNPLMSDPLVCSEEFVKRYTKYTIEDLEQTQYALFDFQGWQIRKITLGVNSEDDLIETIYPERKKIHTIENLSEEEQELFITWNNIYKGQLPSC